MTGKPPLWADALLTVWVLIVAVFYFGGYFLPAEVGVYTQIGAGFYALMLLISAATVAWNYLHRAANKDGAHDAVDGDEGRAHED